MSDIGPDLDAPSPPPAARARRGVNTIAPEPERARREPAVPSPERPEVGEPSGPSHRPGDVPDSLTHRYFTEALRGGSTLAYYEGPGSKRVAFQDHGSRLATDQTSPVVVRDLAAIAAHRGWSAVRVTGQDDFRRELWMEARALGLQVKGYRPKERDQQELDRRLDSAKAPVRSDQRPQADKPRLPTQRQEKAGPRSTARRRPDYDKGVAGVLLESGRAPYRRRTGEPETPFVRIDRGDGRRLDIWGVGLPDALARSGAQKGDAIQVRRDGVDVLQRTINVRDDATGVVAPGLRDVLRNCWVIEADRFRETTPAQAARDTDLSGAQSHLRVLDSAIDGAIRDPERRARLHAEARELVAGEVAQGRRFPPARVREVEPMLARDIAEAKARDGAPERTHRR